MFLSRCSAILFVMCLSIGEISSQVRIRHVLDFFHNFLSLFFFFLYLRLLGEYFLSFKRLN